MQKSFDNIVVFLTITTCIILVLVSFIITIIYLYRRKQVLFLKGIEELKIEYNKSLLSSRLELQEQIFKNISSEIHDNISLSLTLAKLHLNTLNWNNQERSICQVNSSVELITRSITDLSSISRSLDSDLISQHGFIKSIENELRRIGETELFRIEYSLTGEPVYFDAQKELIIFRIIQEGFNNIIKHANASYTALKLHYCPENLQINIIDNGRGFELGFNDNKLHAGLKNMESRIKMINGTMEIKTLAGQGTLLTFIVPLK